MTNYYREFINFLKKHNIYNEEILNYIKYHSTRFDYRDDEKRPFIGCYYSVTKKDILQKFTLYIPIINSPIAVLINIHEYLHAIELYSKLGKKYKPQNSIEVLPMLYEYLYFTENPSKELESHLTYLNNKITEDSPIKYQIAINIQSELLEYYQEKNPSLKTLEKKTKKLTRKYQSK